MSDLEARVAALEALLMPAPDPGWTEEQLAWFQEAVSSATGALVKVLPPLSHVLAGEEIRSLLRQCVTVVEPGETLIFSPVDPWTPNQVREMQDYANQVIADLELGFRMLVVPSGSFGMVMPPAGDPSATTTPGQ